MFYYGSIFVTNADAPNLVGDNDDEGYDPAGDTPWLDWVDSRI
jgi:hypothetical protein